MHAQATTRLSRKLTLILSALLLAGCGQGDGPQSIAGIPATPLPPIPPGFCDAINFEILCPPVNIVNFNGGATVVIDNPDKSGINTSDLVARMQKFPDQAFGGTKLDRGAPIDFADGEAFTVKVWSSRNVALTFKLDEQNKERVQNHSGSSSWETLCFDFSGNTAGAPNPGLTLIFDNGTLGQADTDPANWTFFYDDVTQVASCGGGGPAAPDLPVDFEGGVDAWFSDFGGGAARVIANPDMSGINTSATVARMQKFAGEVFGGSTLTLGNAVDFGQGEAFKVKVWASRMVPVLFKLEGLNQELAVSHGGSGAWEELCFDFTGNTTGPAATAITFIFDLGVEGDAAGEPNNWTFYFDDIAQAADCGGGGADPGIIPEDVVYATDPGQVIDLPPPAIDNFGSGAVFDFTYAADADFNPALQVTSGEGYGGGVHVGFIAFNGYAPGFAAGYGTFEFKAKVNAPGSATAFEVKFINGGDTSVTYDLTSYAGSTALGNGWYQVQIPMSDFAATIAANSGFLLGPLGGQAGAFTMLLTDIGFSGTAGGGGGGGITPEAVVYATDPGVTEDLAPPAIDNFGSGAAFDGAFAGDADYNPAFQVTSGEGYGGGVHVGFVAFNGYAAGFAAGYGTFEFKAKVNAPGSASAFEVKFINGGDTSVTYDLTSYAGSTALGNGWYQVQIPMSDFAATIAANSGFLLGPLGGQAGAFTMLLTDIGFSGTAGGGGGGGITPEAVVYATDPGVTEDLAPPAIDNFGSGAAFDGAFAGDADYNPAFQVTSGEGYGGGVHVGFVAFNGYAVGFAAGYGTFEFKAKVNAPGSASAFEVKFINGGDTSRTYDLTSYAGSTALGNGWYQVQIPMSDFAATIAANSGFLLGPLGGQAGAFTMLLTDIGFSGTAGGGGNCDPVGAELATNGNFEAGDLSCWEAITNGGTITADNTQNNTAGGSWSAHAVTAGASNPTLKQNFLAAGTVMIGDVIDISFDMKGTAAAGGVIFPKLISEGATGSDGPILQTIDTPTAGWTTYTYSPTITADVTRGITFEISVVCGAVAGCTADVFIDNVSVQIR